MKEIITEYGIKKLNLVISQKFYRGIKFSAHLIYSEMSYASRQNQEKTVRDSKQRIETR